MADTFAIGDIHGCFLTFKKLLETMNVQEEDGLILLGDLVDRGPRIKEVLDYALNRPNTFIVVGNHDYYFFDYARNGKRASNEFMWNQGLKETMEQLGDDAVNYANRMMEKISTYIKDPHGEYVFCHSNYPWEEEDGVFTEAHFWDRWTENPASSHGNYNGPIIVHGHTPRLIGQPFKEIVNGKTIGINLDGGCCYGRPNSGLRGLRLSDGQIFEELNID